MKNRTSRPDRSHLLPFGGVSPRTLNRASAPAPEPIDTSAERALAWARSREERAAAARANRATPNGALVGSRFMGGCSASARCR